MPQAYAGTWYVLVYGDTISTPGNYGLQVTTSGMFLTSVTPNYHGASADAVLTLSGAGFDPTTVVSLVSSNGTAYSNNLVSVDSFTQITATVPSNSVPPGRYTVRLSQPDGDLSELVDAFEMQATAVAKLELKLIVPSAIGRHATATFFVEYANTGNAAIPAPIIVLHGTEQAFLTLKHNIVTQGFWTSAQPEGFSDTIQFLAQGDTPGFLQPGESKRVPVYYAGLKAPWSWRPTTEFRLGWLPADASLVGAIGGFQQVNPDDYTIDWAALRVGMRPASIDTGAWDIIWANFVEGAGNTWFDYVRMLAHRAYYLSRNSPIAMETALCVGPIHPHGAACASPADGDNRGHTC